MSEERLEEIKGLFDSYWTSEEPSEQLDLSIDILQDHVGYLIDRAERVQELERENQLLKGRIGIHSTADDKAVEIIEEKEQQNKRYRSALEEIASTPSWDEARYCSHVASLALESEPDGS